MDWTQASLFETLVFNVGILVIGLLAILVVGTFLWCLYCFASDEAERIRRRKKTTRALWCGKCCNNVDGKCKRFGLVIANAPVQRPGCSWGLERKDGDGWEVRDD